MLSGVPADPGSRPREKTGFACPRRVSARSYTLMAPVPDDTPSELTRLLRRSAQGDQAAWGELLERHRDRLRRMVMLRLDRRLQGRVDASDVLQEAYIEASRRLADYLGRPDMPFFVWLRFLVGQKLLEEHRRHLGVQARDAGREVALHQGALPEATSAALAAQLLGRLTSPSRAAQRAERKVLLEEALGRLDPLDREILALRHFEQLTNGEAAAVLGLDRSAASKRYARALVRLKDALAGLPGGETES
jgi:RNA polymerase sigma-70 factor (ECF subfamily)